jgi:hypothetical protein
VSDDVVDLKLGRDEALVLFELIADYDFEPELELAHQADRIAIIRLAGAFEKTLAEPFRRDYLELVNAARARLADRYRSPE